MAALCCAGIQPDRLLVRSGVGNRHGGAFRGADERSLAAVEALSRGIVNKLLHAPLSRLREELEGEAGLAHLEAARSLFALDDDDPDDEVAAGAATSEEPDAEL